MSFFDYLRGIRKPKTATVAKDRLQLILARERVDTTGPDYLQNMKRDLLEVIAKYVQVDVEQVKVSLDRDGQYEVLELNIVLPDAPEPSRRIAAQ